MKIVKGSVASDYDSVRDAIKSAINAMQEKTFSASKLRKSVNVTEAVWPDSFIHQAAIELGFGVEQL